MVVNSYSDKPIKAFIHVWEPLLIKYHKDLCDILTNLKNDLYLTVKKSYEFLYDIPCIYEE